MPQKHGSIDFENNPQITHMKHEDAARAAIARRHPEYVNVVITGEGGPMGGTQRTATFSYDVAAE
jgi:hypothetical protein